MLSINQLIKFISQVMSHLLKLVLFPDDEEDKLGIDIVPQDWIFESKELKSKACHFPRGPFTSRQVQELHKLVRNRKPPKKSWPVHRIKIHGRARKLYHIYLLK